MKMIRRILKLLAVKPAVWLCDLPRLRQSSSENLARMSYTAHGSGQALRASFSGAIRARLKTISPAYLAGRFLRAALEERANRALSMLPAILGEETPVVHVVDCGAAENYSRIWDHFGSKIRIHMFEPEAAAFEKLVDAYRGDSRLSIHNSLVSEDGQPLTLKVYLWPRGSSVFSPNYGFVNQTAVRRHYELVTQKTFLSKPLRDILGDTDVSFIKAHVEGSELAILRGAGNLLSGCVGVDLELWYNGSILTGAPLCSDVMRFCHDLGLSVVYIDRPRKWHYRLPNRELESKGFISDGYALFLRLPHDVVDLVAAGIWKREKLAIAACIYLAYRHYEFAFHLVQQAVEAGLLARDDRVAQQTLECIHIFSAHDRIISYRQLKALLHRIEGSDPDSNLWF